MIISLGYRVKSSIATNFRRWATGRLKEYMIKGFAMDDERLTAYCVAIADDRWSASYIKAASRHPHTKVLSSGLFFFRKTDKYFRAQLDQAQRSH